MKPASGKQPRRKQHGRLSACRHRPPKFPERSEITRREICTWEFGLWRGGRRLVLVCPAVVCGTPQPFPWATRGRCGADEGEAHLWHLNEAIAAGSGREVILFCFLPSITLLTPLLLSSLLLLLLPRRGGHCLQTCRRRGGRLW